MNDKNEYLEDKTILAKNDEKTNLAKKNNKNEFNMQNDEETKLASIIAKDELKINDEISFDDTINGYKLGKIISESTGESVIRLCVKDEKTYAIKIYNSGREVSNELEDKLIEISIKNNIVPILSKGTFKGHRYEVIPYYKNGTVFDKKEIIDNAFLSNVLIPQMNEALHAIHSNNIFHNDIKPSNIFLSDDMKNVYLGDFGISKLTHGRDVVTNLGNFSRGYAAPEASRISDTKTDYYSFGVSILVLCPENPYAGTFELEKELLTNGVTFSNNMDSNIADLIYLLCQYDPNKRIGYEDVKKWIKDNSCFKGVRETKQSDVYYRELQINKYKFRDADGNAKIYYDGILLAQALANNPAQALEHYKAGFLLDTYKNADQELGIKLKQIFDENKDDPSRGLALFIKTINNSFPLVYKEINVLDLAGYVDYICNNYSKVDESYVDHRIIKLLLNNIQDEKVIKIWDYILSKPQNERIDLICNFYRKDTSFYLNKKMYKNFGLFLEKELATFKEFKENNINSITQFNNVLKQIDNKFDYFFVCSMLNQDFSKNKDINIGEFINNHKYNLALNSAKLYLGYMPIILFGKPVKNLYDFVNINSNIIEDAIANDSNPMSTVDVKTLNNFISSEIFEIILQNEDESNTKIKCELGGISTDYKAFTLYYLTVKDALYNGCRTIKELADYVANANDIKKISNLILNDPLYKMWLKSKGVEIQ